MAEEFNRKLVRVMKYRGHRNKFTTAILKTRSSIVLYKIKEVKSGGWKVSEEGVTVIKAKNNKSMDSCF